MKFRIASGYGKNVILLRKDSWDDFGYKTTFHAKYCDNKGIEYELGTVKIAKYDMGDRRNIDSFLPTEFDSLQDGFFSLWQTAEAYRRVLECEKKCHFDILRSLNDIAYGPELYEKYKNEEVLKTSLFRSVSVSLYMRQFQRIARGEAVLTSYHFRYVIESNNPYMDNCSLDFSVVPDSLPPTNVHALIGSNGTGKTMLIKQMIKAICGNDSKTGRFSYYLPLSDTEDGIFENIICVSFSPFDDYSEVENCSKKFKFIGIRKEYDSNGYEDGYGEISLLDDIRNSFIISLENCLADTTKIDDLLEMMKMLETDCNFLSVNYDFSLNVDEPKLIRKELIEDKAFDKLSAGHKVVLSIITRCIDELVEKSVVLIDEPENHLHPPLLSSLIRGISKMLMKRNGVAIISTHSPIVLQEIPRSNVWILNRVGDAINARRPDIETFGTNIGVLTNEIFGYEVQKTGFSTLLQSVVDRCENYESVIDEFNYQLGDEAKSIVRTMLKQKEKG